MMLDALSSISEAAGSDKQLSAQFRAAVVAFTSETPDNMNCVDRIHVGSMGDARGLKFREADLMLSEVAHALEAVPMPEELCRSLPELSEADWYAFLRLSTPLYLALEAT